MGAGRLAAGADPAEVETRRDLIEQTHNVAERLMDDVERLAAAPGLMLEQGDGYDGRAVAGLRAFDEVRARYDEFTQVVGASARHVEGELVAKAAARGKKRGADGPPT